MERVIEVLRALLESVLLENGETTPALTGVAVRGTRGDSDVRLTVQFANGCSASQRVSRYDLSDFCAAHGTWTWRRFAALSWTRRSKSTSKCATSAAPGPKRRPPAVVGLP